MPFFVTGSVSLPSSSLVSPSFDSELDESSVVLAGLVVLEGKSAGLTEPSLFRARLRLATAFASLSVRRSWALVVDACREGPSSCQPNEVPETRKMSTLLSPLTLVASPVVTSFLAGCSPFPPSFAAGEDEVAGSSARIVSSFDSTPARKEPHLDETLIGPEEAISDYVADCNDTR